MNVLQLNHHFYRMVKQPDSTLWLKIWVLYDLIRVSEVIRSAYIVTNVRKPLTLIANFVRLWVGDKSMDAMYKGLWSRKGYLDCHWLRRSHRDHHYVSNGDEVEDSLDFLSQTEGIMSLYRYPGNYILRRSHHDCHYVSVLWFSRLVNQMHRVTSDQSFES